MKPPMMKRYAPHVTTMYPERIEIGYIHLTEQEND